MSRKNRNPAILKLTTSSTSGKIATSGAMRPRRRMAENYLVIWVDGSIDTDNQDCKNKLEQLHTVINEVKLCTKPKQCVEFLNGMGGGKAFVISSGALGKNLVHNIHGMTQVDAIYIFHGNRALHEQWSKVRGIFNSMKPICESLKKIVAECQYNYDAIPMSFVPKRMMTEEATASSEQNHDQLPPSYMYSVIFKDIILEIDDDDTTQFDQNGLVYSLFIDGK
ncbi:unnamed protein product [Rotaria magnacalcarata]|uniref:Uncharacterized protein n=2 Tax=Rotaria magnacalcarata TaxID=392030 RepID=A0A816D0U5_9BILA|nr:unnamed protein product [Rotaria magnacalcarata]CAF1628594.1 unnamed protein product [Rotaria magnacalcarata]CAF3843612.1 unnamed protein product [Rotaria magnacalcarata]CAF3852655.1 unnamed protein product [Rotaria magnacalcarata]